MPLHRRDAPLHALYLPYVRASKWVGDRSPEKKDRRLAEQALTRKDLHGSSNV
jgi:hypothetical protein